MRQQQKILAGLLAVVLIAMVAWSYTFMADMRSSARAAAYDLNKCRQLAGQIESLSNRPTMASDTELLAGETTGLAEQAAKAAGIPASSLVRINPDPPQRLADSVYKEKPTNVHMKNVTLKQLVTMVYKMTDGPLALHPKSIRLTAPRVEDTGDRWTAELVMTYLIYDPPGSR